MSLAAFSILVVAFLCMTGEASVIPNRSSSSELHSPITIDSQFPTTQKILTTSYDQEEESRFPKFKIPRLSLSRPEGSWTEIPRADWSERVLSAWCYGEAGDKDIEEDGDTDAVRRLRSMLCQMQSPSVPHLEALDVEAP